MPSSATDGVHIGVDVGGTKALAVAVSSGDLAHVLAQRELPTASRPDVHTVIDALVAMLRDDLPASTTRSIGVGMPGLVTLRGVLRYGPNLPGAVDVDVAPELTQRYGCPVAVDNDGNCAAWAEAAFGAGRSRRDVLFIGLGTGISCGMTIDGRRVRGHHGFAGEPGHMVIDADGPGCACGRRGCWEALASGSALAAQARAACAQGRAPRLVELAGGDPGAVRGEHVSAALHEGDEAATQIATDYSARVAQGLANLVHLLDPAVVVLGGSVVSEAEPWLTMINAAYRRLVMQSALRTTEVVAARLGRRSGAIGAALIGAELIEVERN